LIALMQTATTLPVFLVGLLAGALADIVNRRLLLATQGLILVAARRPARSWHPRRPQCAPSEPWPRLLSALALPSPGSWSRPEAAGRR